MRTATTSPLLHIIHWTWIDEAYSRYRSSAIMDTWGSGYCGLTHGGGLSADLGLEMIPRGPSHLREAIIVDYGDGRDFGFK